MDTQELLQIKVKISDKTALYRLTPEMVTGYLARHGWILHDTDPRCTTWWKLDEFLLVPATRDVGDYGLRLSEVIRDVAWTEDRSELAVFVDILEGN
jgi:hypothetical protein